MKVTFGSVLTFFCLLAILGWSQATNSRQVFNKDGDPSKKDWIEADSLLFFTGSTGRQYNELKIPFLGVQTNEAAYPSLSVKLPPELFGYTVNIGTTIIHQKTPPVINVHINGDYLDTFHVTPFYWPEKTHGRDCKEVFIPGNILKEGKDNTLLIRSTGGSWIGRILVIPYGRLRLPLQILIPLLGALTLILSARFSGKYWGISQKAIIFIVLFFTYFYTLFTKQMAPMDGFLWDDATCYIDSIINFQLTFKMAKHMLLFPVMHGFYKLVSLMFHRELIALSVTFACVAAANGIVMFACLNKLLKNTFTSMLFTVLYAFSFSIWSFSSIFESYIFPSLLVNIFLLVLLSVRNKSNPWHYITLSAIVVLAGLAHPPLLILISILVIDLFLSKQSLKTKTIISVTAIALVIVGFLSSRLLIRACYPEADGDYMRQANFSGELSFASDTVGRYASLDHLTISNIGNVVLGQCYYAIGGFPYAFKWYKGWSGILDYFRTIPGVVFFLSTLCLWVTACLYTLKDSVFRRFTILGLIAFVLPTFAFYWHLNPHEMLLYSAPFNSIIIIWMALAVRPVLQKHDNTVVLITCAATVLLNTLALISYH